MKTRFTLLGIVAAVVIGIAAVFVSCNKELNDITTYRGEVVYINTTTPFPNLQVKVTDGKNTHCQTLTDDAGQFSLKVRVNEIDGNYYLLAGDSTCIPKKVALGGYGQAEVDLGVIEVEGPAMPTVKTMPASDISDKKATCGGEVTADGRSSVTARGVCWSQSEYPTIDDEHTINGFGLGTFKSQITDLEQGTTYYVRAYATNCMGTAYGEQLSLSTKTGLPQVITDTVSNVSATSARCSGYVISNGGYVITARGVCWSNTSSTPTPLDEHTTEIADIGAFSSVMTNLEANTLYYVRAYAINEAGIGYGASISFLTGKGLPSVETLDPGENITSSSISAVGNITDDGGFSITERGIVYSTFPYPTLENSQHISNGGGVGYFSLTITGVSPAQYTYYLRAYAINQQGTAYGDQVVITPERLKYIGLRTMIYAGYTYKIMPLDEMTWNNGYQTCEKMEYGGYDDWYMANDSEIKAAFTVLGTTYNTATYWASNGCGNYYHYCLYYMGEWISNCGDASQSELYKIMAVRKYLTNQ